MSEAGRFLVEAPGLVFHHVDRPPHLRNRERFHLPDGAALHEAGDVLAADQRNVIPEAFAIGAQEPMPVFGFLLLHFCQRAGRVRIIRPKLLGKIAKDASVVFLQRNRQSEDFLFREGREGFGHGEQLSW